ncbi:MAG: thiamine biosynthesis protein ThiF [Oscillospiraceae bacterium]
MAVPSREEMYAALEARHGSELQRKISAASVAVCGLGGLGSNIAIMLARAGIGRLHLIDFDRVDLSNMNRQQYFVRQLGMFKTEALRDTLRDIAPYCQIEIDTVRITEDNLVPLLQNEDIICEAFDNAECKAMLVNGVLENLPEKYLTAASGMAGLSSANEINTRKITERFYLCGDGKSDVADGMGLVSTRVTVCAAHEAHAVIKIIEGK